jgi:hypothetical protein
MRWSVAMMLASLFVGGAALAQAPGDAANGRDLSERLCRGCHLVSPEQRGPVPDGVASFMAIAGWPEVSARTLGAALLSPPHPLMPDPPLSRQQMNDVAAYILSLRR